MLTCQGEDGSVIRVLDGHPDDRPGFKIDGLILPDSMPRGAHDDASTSALARLLTPLYERLLRGTGIEAPQFALLMALDAQGASKSDLTRAAAMR